MLVKCIMCGREENITKLHKDYRKLEADPHASYYCNTCILKLSSEANKQINPSGKGR